MTAGGHAADALTIRGIEKRFGDLVAVKELSLSFRAGEVHALLGENGAGKTTLMNVAAGFLTPDQGEIDVGGQPMSFGSPRVALAAGIGMVHQHFRLVEKFTVAENLAIGATDVSQVTSTHQLVERASKLAERFGVDIDATQPVWALSEGEKQRVEILRTLSRGAKVLILDEPTAVLSTEEAEHLCTNLRMMAAEGTTVVFISHKLPEVLSVADRISVMRHGALLATKDRPDCTVESLSKLMFEELDAVRETLRHRQRKGGGEVLRVSHLSARTERGVPALHDVSFSVNQNEIVGIVGVAGNGQLELVHMVTGHRRPDEGEITIGGKLVQDIRDTLRAGLAYIPEDRKGTGLIPSQSIWRNAIMRNYHEAPVNRGGVISGSEARTLAAELIDRVDLSTKDTAVLVQQLSGGNAQKLLAGRELDHRRRVVVAVNPTQGLDVRAASAVRDALDDACEKGLAVLLISADLDEVLGLADRILVLYEGKIAGEFNAEEADRDRIGLLMGGATP